MAYSSFRHSPRMIHLRQILGSLLAVLAAATLSLLIIGIDISSEPSSSWAEGSFSSSSSGRRNLAVRHPIHLVPDITYKTTPQGELQLDLFYPEVEPSGKYPVVIYTHGGGWARGFRGAARGGSQASHAVKALTEVGFAVASVDYRLWVKGGETSIRECVIDAMDAVRYLVKNGENLHIDADSIFTFGDSAGGQIAQMLLYSPDGFPGDEALQGIKFQATAGVTWYAPCDFENTELYDTTRWPYVLFGRAERTREERLQMYREVSPVHYLSASSPPLLMFNGNKDTTIPVRHAHYMQERAQATGASVETVIVENSGHNWRQEDETQPLKPSLDEILERTVAFFVAHRGETAPQKILNQTLVSSKKNL